MTSQPSFDFKFQSLNVRGLNKSIKRRAIFRWLHNQKHHFTFLQETYSSKECAQIWETEWGGKVFFSHGSSHSKGVMILVNPNLDFKVEECVSDKNGRFLILNLIIDESHLGTLVNIYAPNDANQQAPVPGKPISVNRGLNRLNPGIKFILRLISVPESTISSIQRINQGLNLTHLERSMNSLIGE